MDTCNQREFEQQIEALSKRAYSRNRIEFTNSHSDELLKANRMRDNFEHTLKYIDTKKHFYREVADVKVLILTATEIERETLFSCFTIYPCSSELVEENVIIQIPYDGLIYSFFYINDIKVVHVEPEMTGSNSKGGTAETLGKALKRVSPTIVVSVGVGFGCDINKSSLCDVLVGRQFFSYDKSTKIHDNELNVKKLHIHEADGSLLYKMKAAMMFEGEITGIFENKFKPHIGNLITGEYVVDSKIFRDMIFAHLKRLVL